MTATSDIVMPKLGLTMTEGVLAEWKVQRGSTVRAGDTLFVVETEKVANEVAAEHDGIIEDLLIEAGATVPVGSAIARFRSANGVTSKPAEKKPEVTESASQRKGADRAPILLDRPPLDGRTIATPYARRLARERGVDLSSVRGTGPRGRIKAVDVEAASASPKAVPANSAMPEEYPAASSHFQFLAEIDATRLAELQRDIAASITDTDVPIAAFVVMASAKALRPHSSSDDAGAVDISIRSGGSIKTTTIGNAAERKLLELVTLLAHPDAESPRNAASSIAVADLGIRATHFFAPPIEADQLLTIGIGSPRAGDGVEKTVLGLSVSVNRRINIENAGQIVDDITRNLEHPLAMLASS